MKKRLIIEDDRNVSEVLHLKLSMEGYNAEVAHDGKTGWAKVQSERPDLIILDVGIPTIDGCVLCEI